MTESVAEMLKQADELSMPEREELAEKLVENLVRDIPPEVQHAHAAEVRRRIAEVESGEVSVVPGEEALEQVRRVAAAARAGSR